MKLPGARILLECLKREGVDLIFGLPGGAVLPIYDALYDFEGLRHILVRQEAAAGHAAEGYARATGKVGVCLVTSGPACTNLVTALQDAMMDSIPIVAFTGQVPTHLIGNDAFQEADNVGITRSATKHNFLVKDGDDLAGTIKEAFFLARSGRRSIRISRRSWRAAAPPAHASGRSDRWNARIGAVGEQQLHCRNVRRGRQVRPPRSMGSWWSISRA